MLHAAFSVVRWYATVRQKPFCSNESTRNNRGSSIFCGSAQRLYNEDLTQLELSLELSSARISEKRWQLQQRTESSSELAVVSENRESRQSKVIENNDKNE
jgi:hypothetical protein